MDRIRCEREVKRCPRCNGKIISGDKYKDFSAYEYYIYDYETLDLLERKKEK